MPVPAPDGTAAWPMSMGKTGGQEPKTFHFGHVDHHARTGRASDDCNATLVRLWPSGRFVHSA